MKCKRSDHWSCTDDDDDDDDDDDSPRFCGYKLPKSSSETDLWRFQPPTVRQLKIKREGVLFGR